MLTLDAWCELALNRVLNTWNGYLVLKIKSIRPNGLIEGGQSVNAVNV